MKFYDSVITAEMKLVEVKNAGIKQDYRVCSHHLDQFALVMKAGESMIRISKVPDFTPIRSTVLGWEVQNIETAVASLKKQGVAFEKYPFIQDAELGIWTAPTGDKVAWFKDPDGNVLSVSQHK
ncbi:MAG: glyoxalase [Acidobacteria bacterium]|nr:MAG: glyoxalase [Acidobacteriota bacterium]